MNAGTKLLCLLCMGAPLASHADDGWWSSTGSIGAFGKNHPTISMVSEDLRITLRDKVDPRVVVDFVFRNDGPATQVTMAFPEKYQLRTKGSLDHLRSFVDGKPVKTTRKIVKRGTPRDEADTIDEAVWLKTVPFAAHQTRKVRVEYNAWYSGDTVGDVSLTYILTTGATWKGPIGQCKITVDFSKLNTLSAPCPVLRGATWRYPRAGIVTATLNRWEPDSDLVLSMVSEFWNLTLNGKPLDPEDCRFDQLPPYTVGSHSDPMVSVDCLGQIFGAEKKVGKVDEGWRPWLNPICEKFGGAFEIDAGVMTLGSGREIKLPRGSKTVLENLNGEKGRPHAFVYLKDVVEALGGKYHYSPEIKQIQLRF